MSKIQRTRENWLNDAVAIFAPKFEDMGFPLPNLRVAVGYGPDGARFENNVILGVALNSQVVNDGAFEIWISPEIQSQADALATLIHELAHCAAGFSAGHKRGSDFEIIVRMFGLEGPLTATTAGEGLKDELELLTIELGDYPGSYVDLSLMPSPAPVPAGGIPVPLPPLAGGGRISTGPAKQTTRLHKIGCTTCGYTVRVSQRWILVGMPICPCGEKFSEMI